MIAGVEAQKLFEPFLDADDMVMCCSADISLAQINAQAADFHLRFPLVWDPSASLGKHLANLEYTPHSARFGPYIDNVLGMNWEFKAGTVVRIGERVIKSTTGYDLLRFLLHSDGRYGRAVDYVLRLRPLGGATARATLSGATSAIERVYIALIRSPWIHWLDVVDLSVTATDLMSLELAADCTPGEEIVFQDYFHRISRENRTELLFKTAVFTESLPALSLKTTVSAAYGLARQLIRDHGGRARVLCVNGVVHYFPPAELRSPPEGSLSKLTQQCTPEGGHLSGPWVKASVPTATEAAWANTLEAVWNRL
jgi:FAD/FMN-containing dehydrogenase